MLKTVSCLTFFVKTDTCFQEKSKEQHLFENWNRNILL